MERSEEPLRNRRENETQPQRRAFSPFRKRVAPEALSKKKLQKEQAFLKVENQD